MDKDMWSLAALVDLKQRRLLTESYAEGIETIITNDRYRTVDPGYFRAANSFLGWNFTKQRQFPNAPETSGRRMSDHSPFCADLHDNVNQNHFFRALTPQPPIDRVEGYTVQQIQSSIKDSRTLFQFRNSLIDDHDNPTESNLDELFLYLQDVLDGL